MNSLLPILKLVVSILATAAGGLIALSQAGTVLPGWLLAVCTGIVSIAAGLGIASSGINPPAPAAPAPALDKQAAIEVLRGPGPQA